MKFGSSTAMETALNRVMATTTASNPDRAGHFMGGIPSAPSPKRRHGVNWARGVRLWPPRRRHEFGANRRPLRERSFVAAAHEEGDALGLYRSLLAHLLLGLGLGERGVVGIAMRAAAIERFLAHQPIERGVLAESLHEIRIGDK